MRPPYLLFQSHLDFAHELWAKLITIGDSVIDATSGNGHDSLFLAQLALSNNAGSLLAIDIQQDALENTRRLLGEKLSPKISSRITFYCGCHSTFPSTEAASIKLIVYNLGYLPGGNKKLTTERETTLTSIKHALPLISMGGAISITCYPGHMEGKEEEALLLEFTSKLEPNCWSVTHHRWINRLSAPSLIFIQKSLS